MISGVARPLATNLLIAAIKQYISNNFIKKSGQILSAFFMLLQHYTIIQFHCENL